MERPFVAGWAARLLVGRREAERRLGRLGRVRSQALEELRVERALGLERDGQSLGVFDEARDRSAQLTSGDTIIPEHESLLTSRNLATEQI